MKYDSPTVPMRIAIRAAQNEDWDRAEAALLESLSVARKKKQESLKEAAKA